MSGLGCSRGFFWHRCSTFHLQLLNFKRLVRPFSPAYCVSPDGNLNLQRSQPFSLIWYHLQRCWGFVPSQQSTSLIQMLNMSSTRLSGRQCTWHCTVPALCHQLEMQLWNASSKKCISIEQKHSSVLSGPVSRKLITDTSSAEGLQQVAKWATLHSRSVPGHHCIQQPRSFPQVRLKPLLAALPMSYWGFERVTNWDTSITATLIVHSRRYVWEVLLK